MAHWPSRSSFGVPWRREIDARGWAVRLFRSVTERMKRRWFF
jgi:hypothetical protein